MHTVYGGITHNGYTVGDMVDANYDIVYPIVENKYFTRLSFICSESEERQPAIVAFSYKNPYTPLFAMPLNGKYEDYSDGYNTTKRFANKLEKFKTAFLQCYVTARKVIKKSDCMKLARLIKIAAKDVSQESAWWKTESVGAVLGFTDRETALEVEDDSGYRSILVGDVKGKNGYALLYSENSSYQKSRRVWKYRCFPPTEDIADMLYALCIGNYQPQKIRYYNSDKDITKSLTFLASATQKYVIAIANDTRTAQEIFDACQ